MEPQTKVLLFGSQVKHIVPYVQSFPNLQIVEQDPDIIICYGGDGTLLRAELEWPSISKVPIRNSRRGKRCIPHPPQQVLERLIQGTLTKTTFIKLECAIQHTDHHEPVCFLTAMNEFNVHMAHINSAVRFTLSLDNKPYADGQEIIGDGFVVCTPFGSTAYFNQITRGIFHSGIGIAFKYTAEHTNHVVSSEKTTFNITITRGPATLAFDNSLDYFELKSGDTLSIKKHRKSTTVLTWDEVRYPSDHF